MKNQASSNGLGLGSVLVMIFLVLKLCGLISWSWWWVFSPVWIPLSLVLLFVVFCLIMNVIFKK